MFFFFFSNWGTENDNTVYHTGNSDPRGYGHIGLMVPDVTAACDRYLTSYTIYIRVLKVTILSCTF